MSKIYYTCGFIFNKKKDEVLLIRKNRPQWQAGMFNGIGGHTEAGETPLECMIRESKEETTIEDKNWQEIAILDSAGFQVNFFAIYNQDLNKIRPLTDELTYPIMIKDIYNPQYYFYNNIQRNLRVLIALAIDDSGIRIPIKLTEF